MSRASLLLLGGEAQVGALHLNPLIVNAVDSRLFLEDGVTSINLLQLLSNQSLIVREVSYVDGVCVATHPPNRVQQPIAPEVLRPHGALTWDEGELASFLSLSKQQRVSALPVLLHIFFDLG